MTQCPEGHLFCMSCINAYSATLLGAHDPQIKCMHQSGCTLPFPPSELQRVLPKKLMELYERVKQKKEIEAAGLDDLEECPFCEWSCVIENQQERLFRCGNEEGGCGIISCRECKKSVRSVCVLGGPGADCAAPQDHLPKSCKGALAFDVRSLRPSLTLHVPEAEEDRQLNGRHTVEEAMSASA